MIHILEFHLPPAERQGCLDLTFDQQQWEMVVRDFKRPKIRTLRGEEWNKFSCVRGPSCRNSIAAMKGERPKKADTEQLLIKDSSLAAKLHTRLRGIIALEKGK